MSIEIINNFELRVEQKLKSNEKIKNLASSISLNPGKFDLPFIMINLKECNNLSSENVSAYMLEFCVFIYSSSQNHTKHHSIAEAVSKELIRSSFPITKLYNVVSLNNYKINWTRGNEESILRLDMIYKALLRQNREANSS